MTEGRRSFRQTVAEVNQMSSRAPVDMARNVTLSDTLMYKMENRVAANPNSKFYMLLLVLIVLCAFYTTLWVATSNSNERYVDSMYTVFQIIAAGGEEDDSTLTFRRLVYLTTMLTGLFLFAVLVGFINDSVFSTFESMNKGHSKVATSGHTLILGWNEATMRVVCQIAFLRRAAKMQNETCIRRLFPWTRVAPSTPVAASSIVVMCNNMEKADMDAKLTSALLERGISPARTKVGIDVVCRIGNPSEPHDLLRVGAHRAKSILVMMTTEDAIEEKESRGMIKCGASLRVLLGLRHVIFNNCSLEKKVVQPGFSLRIVVQLNSASETINAAKFVGPDDNNAVRSLDLRAFVNTLMFNCAAHAGLSAVFMDLLSFEGFAFRSKAASRLDLVGRSIGSCASLWTDAVLCGVVDTRVELTEHNADPQHGLACDPDRQITEHDRVIFIAEDTFPHRARPVDGEKEARLRPLSTHQPQQFNILVCGWRNEWTHNSKRLAARIDGLVQGLCPDSQIVFLNFLKDEEFADMMNNADFQAGEQKWTKNDVVLRHEHGDATDSGTLRKVLSATVFEVAIVLGTVAGSKILSAAAQDSRVLSIMCLLRKVQAELGNQTNLRVVGENMQDSTSMLALPPPHESMPDFINTQAINARALVQALAYPLMQPAIEQLFHVRAGLPRLGLARAGLEFISLGPATFAQVTRTVARQHRGAICLGYLGGNAGSVVYAPAPEETHDYVDGDKLIILSR